MRYGLRFFDGNGENRLIQISGGGRILLAVGARKRWCRPPAVTWQIYETEDGQTYATREIAEQVARNLSAPEGAR